MQIRALAEDRRPNGGTSILREIPHSIPMQKDYFYENLDHHFSQHRDYSGRAMAKNDMQKRKFHAHAVGSYILAYTADMNKRQGGAGAEAHRSQTWCLYPDNTQLCTVRSPLAAP